MSTVTPQIPSPNGEPAWEAAFLLPPQGRWNESDFLELHTNRMAELVDGRLEILPMPTLQHQRMLIWLLDVFRNAVAGQVGASVLIAPLPAKLFPGTVREPDLLYIAPENAPAPDVKYPSHIDLVVEIVSEGEEARRRDYEQKRIDYAKAGIAEYWIVDPQEECVSILVLEGTAYIDHAVFRSGQQARGLLLPGLSVDVKGLIGQ